MTEKKKKSTIKISKSLRFCNEIKVVTCNGAEKPGHLVQTSTQSRVRTPSREETGMITGFQII